MTKYKARCPVCGKYPDNPRPRCPYCQASMKIIPLPKPWKSKAEVLASYCRPALSPLTPELGEFGLAVRKERIRQHMTQIQFAEKFGVDTLTMRKVEQGKLKNSKQSRGNMKDPLLVEKLRIWLETNKPLRERPKADNVDLMFKDLKG